jgi:hypothetical protein
LIPRRDLEVTRPAGGEYVEGVYQEGATSSLTIQASVQPLSGRQLQALPEGRRNRESYRLFSDQGLRPYDGQNPDRVLIDGHEFEVFSVSPWQNGILPHFDMIVQRIGPAQPAPVEVP